MPRGGVALVKGPMFSGKTELLIELAEKTGKWVQAFKPKLDTRYGARPELVAHNGQRYPAWPVKEALEILNLLIPGTTRVAIDEAQFFDHSIIPVVRRLVECGIEVVIAGLNFNFRREPFGCMPQLEQAVREMKGQVLTLTATCAVCGGEAAFTQRLIDRQPARWDDPVIVVGAAELYEPRCRECHWIDKKVYAHG